MRKLDFDDNDDDNDKVKSASVKSVANNPKIETTLEVIENLYPRLIVRSNTGKKYVIVLNNDLYQAKCSCPSWIFRGAKLAKEAGKVGRAPCKHIRAIQVESLEQRSSFAARGIPPVYPLIGQRFSILDF